MALGRAVHVVHTLLARNEDLIRHATEEAMLHHTNHLGLVCGVGG